MLLTMLLLLGPEYIILFYFLAFLAISSDFDLIDYFNILGWLLEFWRHFPNLISSYWVLLATL